MQFSLEERIGLSENMNRVRMQRAVEVLLALAAQGSRARLGREWFDGLARHESQIEHLDWAVNSLRAQARAMARGK